MRALDVVKEVQNEIVRYPAESSAVRPAKYIQPFAFNNNARKVVVHFFGVSFKILPP
jgi:hypothetical protein